MHRKQPLQDPAHRGMRALRAWLDTSAADAAPAAMLKRYGRESVQFTFLEPRQMHDIDPLVAQRIALINRRLTTNRPLWRFVVMNLASLFGK